MKRSIKKLKKKNLITFYSLILATVLITMIYLVIPTIMNNIATGLTKIQLALVTFVIQVVGTLLICISFIFIAVKITE